MRIHLRSTSTPPDDGDRPPGSRTIRVVASLSALVAGGGGLLVAAGPASAVTGTAANGTVLFSHTFAQNSLANDGANGTTAYGAASLPAVPPGSMASVNSACLTVAGGTGVPASCAGASDPAGSGALQLTTATNNEEGGLFSTVSVPSSQGLDITFDSSQYGGNGADGIAFVLAAVDPSDPLSPSHMGQAGGSLGYSASGSVPGLSDGYLGIGFDVYGNYSNSLMEGSGCINPPYLVSGSTVPGQVVVRGPGNGTAGYCAINSTAASTSSPALALDGGASGTRAGSNVPVEVIINTTSAAMTTPSGITVQPGQYTVAFTPIGGGQRTLIGTLPSGAGILPGSWLSATGVPKQLAFGWVASTGGSYDYHTISGSEVTSLNPVPLLDLNQTEYGAGSDGNPITYTDNVSLGATGGNENQPVTVTDTLPTGVQPVSGGGDGWVCAVPSGQTITCTDSNGPFAPGSTLPPLYVNGTVTGGPLSSATLDDNNVAVASSSDGDPSYSSTATAGTLPPAPQVSSATPSDGPLSGGNQVTLSGSNLTDATEVEVGTSAQIAAGTATALPLCQSGQTSGCFEVSGSDLVVPSMPAEAAGAYLLSVVTQGESSSTGYSYTAPVFAASTVTQTYDDGQAYSYTPAVSGGIAPVGYTFTNLPASLTGDAGSGAVTGTVSAGTYHYTITATDAGNQTATHTVDLTVNAAPNVSPATASAGWDVDTAGFSYTPPAPTGGTLPYTWSSTALPDGLSLDTTNGAITGTPTATGTTEVTLTATDSLGEQSAQTVTISINPVPTAGSASGGSSSGSGSGSGGGSGSGSPTVDGDSGTGITYTPPAPVGGTGPYTWVATGLPTGVSVDPATGALSGSATQPGTYTVTETATDANGHSVTETVTLVVAALPSIASPATPAAGSTGTAYTTPVTVAGGTAPFTWAVTSGHLPPGVALGDANGALSGTPTEPGTYAFTVTVTDAVGRTASEAMTLVVKPAQMSSHSIANTPDGRGYWMATTAGQVFHYGDATSYGDATKLDLHRPIVGIEATPDGHGYWLVASDGGVFAFGDAGFYGSTGGIRLNRPVVGMAATPDGAGYWLVATDGGVFAFGDAVFHGSTGGLRLAAPVVGMAADPTGRGYWLAAADGGIFALGDAGFHGSALGVDLNGPIAAIASTPDGHGYWLDGTDGGVFNYGDARFYGSEGDSFLAHPVP